MEVTIYVCFTFTSITECNDLAVNNLGSPSHIYAKPASGITRGELTRTTSKGHKFVSSKKKIV